MKYTREGLLFPDTNTSQLDARLDESLTEALLGSNDEFYSEMTLPAQTAQKVVDTWHRGEDSSLSLEHMDTDRLMAREDSIKRWKSHLISDRSIDPDIAQLYRWKVNEYLANIKMMIASATGDQKLFMKWNEFIYGRPDEDLYRGALDWIAHDAEELIVKPNQHPSVISAARDVIAMLDGKRGYRELLSPNPETFELVRQDHWSDTGYYGLLLAGVEIPEGKIDRTVGDPILQQVIKNIGSKKPLIDADGATWGVSEAGVKRPASYNMPRLRFIGLGPGHEIGSHEIELVNGSRGPLGIVRRGLDRYELGNEGRAVIREQVPYETFDEFGKLVRWRDILRRHIAVSYGWGVGEDTPQSSAKVYAFINTIDRMYQARLTPNDPVSAAANAQRKTDSLLLRVLKGTDGSGGAYLKDKAYLEGNVASWLVADLEGSNAIAAGDEGKLDISNPRHTTVVKKFGLLGGPDD